VHVPDEEARRFETIESKSPPGFLAALANFPSQAPRNGHGEPFGRTLPKRLIQWKNGPAPSGTGPSIGFD
jgi:hypothetical protein